MAGFGHNLSDVILSLRKTIRTSAGSVTNVVICLVTVGTEQLFSFAVFKCPCPQLPVTATAETTLPKGEITLEGAGLIYGLVYILVPAFILFLLGFAMNINTWKLVTGCTRRQKRVSRGYEAGCKTLMEIFMQAMVAPSAWISITLLDGNYLACAITPEPYDMTCEEVVRASSSSMKYTVKFDRNKQISQVIGWIYIATVLLVGSILYLIHRCRSPLTYHHRHYMKWYREIEHQEFEETARAQLTEQAKENITKFLSSKRVKEDWDKISTVFTFKRDSEGYALYSRLDEWNEDLPLLREKEELDRGSESSNTETEVESSELLRGMENISVPGEAIPLKLFPKEGNITTNSKSRESFSEGDTENKRHNATEPISKYATHRIKQSKHNQRNELLKTNFNNSTLSTPLLSSEEVDAAKNTPNASEHMGQESETVRKPV